MLVFLKNKIWERNVESKERLSWKKEVGGRKIDAYVSLQERGWDVKNTSSLHLLHFHKH